VLRGEQVIEIFTADVDASIRRRAEPGIRLDRLAIRLPTLEDRFLVFGLGSISMISLAVVNAARVNSKEPASGLAAWPRMFLSGV